VRLDLTLVLSGVLSMPIPAGEGPLGGTGEAPRGALGAAADYESQRIPPLVCE